MKTTTKAPARRRPVKDERAIAEGLDKEIDQLTTRLDALTALRALMRPTSTRR